jgi:hypothetical protein
MKKKWILVTAVMLVVGVIVQTSAANSRNGETVLEFKTMFGVDGPFRGAANAIRGIPGAGAPWRIDDVDGELKSDGVIKIDVKGLVLVSTGQNPSPTFRAIVSCLTSDGTTVTTVNRITNSFPATPSGDSQIEANVSLPNPCVAPIVFVAPGADPPRWFSVTGV